MNYTLMLNPSIINPFVFGWKFGLKAAWFLCFSLIISLIVFYIFQISVITQASFSIADLEKQIADSDKNFKNLQLNFSGTGSLSDIETALAAKGYEKVGKINYIQVLESTVAAK